MQIRWAQKMNTIKNATQEDGEVQNQNQLPHAIALVQIEKFIRDQLQSKENTQLAQTESCDKKMEGKKKRDETIELPQWK